MVPRLSPETIPVGVDEAGRGCLAGSVFAGAVILQSKLGIRHFQDSKTLSEIRREELFEIILNEHRVGVGFATVEEISQMNILNASLLAMKRACVALRLTVGEISKCHVLVDGNQRIKNFSWTQTPIIGGDDRVKSISAASIVAKVSRDRELRELHEKFPQYGFADHKGYGTEVHRAAIAKHGPTVHHRLTFAGVKEHATKGFFAGAAPANVVAANARS